MVSVFFGTFVVDGVKYKLSGANFGNDQQSMEKVCMTRDNNLCKHPCVRLSVHHLYLCKCPCIKKYVIHPYLCKGPCVTISVYWPDQPAS